MTTASTTVTQRTMSLAKPTRLYKPVTKAHTWDDEAAWLRLLHPRRLARLRRLIAAEGIKEPIRPCKGHPDCGTDWHVVDGHHRVVIAAELGIRQVPVADAWDGSGWLLYASDQFGDDPDPTSTPEPQEQQ